MGYVSVLLTEVNLVSVYKANRLYSAEWYVVLPPQSCRDISTGGKFVPLLTSHY